MYFGHIRPSKGLEDVFQVVLDLQRAKTVKVAIVGQVLSEFESYFTDLKGKYKEVIIDYYLNETSDLVSCLLNNAKIVFFTFSRWHFRAQRIFLAAITNGALVVTYRGRFVTSSLECIFFYYSLIKLPYLLVIY